MDYLVYAYLQLAQDKEARAVVDEMIEIKGYNLNIRTGPYAVAASQARYMIERNDWKGAATLEIRPTQFAYVDALTHFARALGAARIGNLDSVRVDITQLTALREKLRQAKDAYWSEQVDIQWQVATAWLLHAQGKYQQALAMMRDTADTEDRTEKSIVTPGPRASCMVRCCSGAVCRQRRSRNSKRFCTRNPIGSTPSRERPHPPNAQAIRRKPENIQKSSSHS